MSFRAVPAILLPCLGSFERRCGIIDRPSNSMRLASPEDFYNGIQYTYYRHHEGHARRARLLHGLPEPILIVGCGFGFLVRELEQLEKDAHGIDASPYAIANRASPNINQADILRPETWQFGVDFATVITEDLLPCLTDDEARLCAQNCARLASVVIHLVTEQGQAEELNYHSCVEWTRITNQLTFSLEGM